MTKLAMKAIVELMGEERFYNYGKMAFVNVDEDTYENVEMFGNDECFDTGGFYQYGVVKDRIYKFYYDFQDEEGFEIDLDCINYYEASFAVDITNTVNMEE